MGHDIAMTIQTNLIRRGRIYYFRARVPADLAARVGRPELKRTLATTATSAARRRAARARTLANTLFARLRGLPMLTDDEIAQLVRNFYAAKLEEDFVLRQGADEIPEIDAELTALMAGRQDLENQIKDDLRRGRARLVSAEAEAMLIDIGREDVIDDDDEVSYRKLCHGLLRALLEANRRATERDDARFDGQPTDPLLIEPASAPPPAFPVSAASPPPSPPPVAAKQTPTLAKVFERWTNERRPPAKTVLDFRTYVRRFVEVNGDLPVSQITSEHVRDFKDAMLALPARLTKAQLAMTVPQLIVSTKGKDLDRLSARTVKDKALGVISALLGYAKREGFAPTNPASCMEVLGADNSKEPARLPFTDLELNTIFRSPVFTEGFRPVGGAGEAAKWLPLLALFSGARVEELGRLAPADIGDEQGVRYLFIQTLDQDGKATKSVKTRSSRRRVPIHPELVRLGFLAYVEEIRKAGHRTLWPDLKSKRTEITAAWSAWWGRYLDDIGITDCRKVFHSFRHTAKRALRNARPKPVEKTLRDALMGHAWTDVAEEYGLDEEGLGIELPTLYDAICRLTYPGLELTHLLG